MIGLFKSRRSNASLLLKHLVTSKIISIANIHTYQNYLQELVILKFVNVTIEPVQWQMSLLKFKLCQDMNKISGTTLPLREICD